jgi:pyruvate dehydrogenase E2 component (dihydrolipoamide acetyltransferase)
MLTRVTMPSLGAMMEEGTIISWRVKEGDRIRTGGILAEIESDKSVFEYECPCEGVVRKFLVQEGQTCPVQATIAIIGEENEEIPAEWLAATTAQTQAEPSPVASASAPQQREQREAEPKGRISISPRARKLAKELGVDFEELTGTGPGGRIESSDIEKAAKGPKPLQNAIPFDPIRAAINRKVTQSKREIPHFYVSVAADMTAAIAYRESHGKRVSFNALLMKAIIAGLAAEPALNVTYSDAGYVPHKTVNVGMAVETPQGVVIAVVEDVAGCGDEELTDRIASAAEAVRRSDMQAVKTGGACMTISNIGMVRTELFIPVIHPGEAAILGIGSIAQRPVVVDGALAVRPTMPITMCIDHRVADGMVAARFLAAVVAYLESLK